MGRKRKLRNLALVPFKRSTSRCASLPKYIITTSSITLVLSIIFYLTKNTDVINELSDQYDKQYNTLRYGTPDYCNQMYSPNRLTGPLRQRVLNQNDTLESLSNEIVLHTDVTSLALIGTSGVGKSLTVDIIEKNFQWSHNIRRFYWNVNTSPYAQYLRLESELPKYSACGQNLIIIDGIIDLDMDMIKRFGVELIDWGYNNRLKIMAIYVFNVPSFLNADIELIDQRIGKLKTLQDSGITPIVYKRFSSKDLRQCIGAEAMQMNITLNDEQIEEIVESIDVVRSGCKHVYRKVGLYV